MEFPSDVPAWGVVAVLTALALTWAVVTFSIDAHATAIEPTKSEVPFSFEIS